MLPLEPLLQLSSVWSGTTERFGVHLFQNHLTIADMDRMQSTGDEWFARHPGKLVELVVVFPSRSRMTGEERDRMARLMKRWEKDRVAAATVILADGMVGAMHRSILTGLLMVAPPPHPAKVFSEVAAAVEWLVPAARPLFGRGATVASVLRVVDDWCAAFQAR